MRKKLLGDAPIGKNATREVANASGHYFRYRSNVLLRGAPPRSPERSPRRLSSAAERVGARCSLPVITAVVYVEDMNATIKFRLSVGPSFPGTAGWLAAWLVIDISVGHRTFAPEAVACCWSWVFVFLDGRREIGENRRKFFFFFFPMIRLLLLLSSSSS